MLEDDGWCTGTPQTSPTPRLASKYSAGDIAFDDEREVVLKGLPGGQRVVTVRWE